MNEFDRLYRNALLEVAHRAEVVYAAHAPHATGRLGRGIKTVPFGGQFLVIAEAKNPTSGYDYVAVTRFGHKQARIYPRADRRKASVVATGNKRRKGGGAALAFRVGGVGGVGGKMIFRRSVKGFHPTSDWATDAGPEINQESELVARELGHRIEAVGLRRLA